MSNMVDKESIRTILLEIFQSLEEGKFDATSQIVGYLTSGDPGYVATYKNARDKIISLDRNLIIEIIVKEFLGK